MATTLFNTPSANKSVTYSVHDFLFRVRKLQVLCTKLEIDGILIINGFDSNENEQYSKLTSWLFQGYSGSPVDEKVYLDAKYKDFVFLLHKEGASCYLEPELFNAIEKYLISIPNVKIYCEKAKDLEDQDDIELSKITQFYKITKNLESVGVCLGKNDSGKLRNIEKWPLL